VGASLADRPTRPTGLKGERVWEVRESLFERAARPGLPPSRPARNLPRSSAHLPQGMRSRAHFLTPHPLPCALKSNNSWCVGACGLVHTATSERDLAAAIFDGPHAGEAAVSVISRAVDLVVAGGQGLIATRRSAPKVRGERWWVVLGGRCFSAVRGPAGPPFPRSLPQLCAWATQYSAAGSATQTRRIQGAPHTLTALLASLPSSCPC